MMERLRQIDRLSWVRVVAVAVGVVVAVGITYVAVHVNEREQSWVRTARPFTATVGGQSVYAFLRPDVQMLEHARVNAASVRIFAKDGRSVPWRLWGAARRSDRTKTHATSRVEGKTTAKGARATFDIGPDNMTHLGVDIDLAGVAQSGGGEFVARATVEGSNDRVHWAMIGRGTLSAFTVARGDERRMVRESRVEYQPVTFRYVRVTVPGVKAIASVSAVVQSATQATALAPFDHIELPTTAGVNERGATTTVTLDAGYANALVDRLQIETITPVFDMRYELHAANERNELRDADRFRAGGHVYQYEYGLRNIVDDLATRARYVRVRITHGNDKPLRNLTVRLFTLARPVLFKVEGKPPYRVTYGSGVLDRPDDSFSRSTDTPADAQVPPVQWDLTAERRNPEHAPALVERAGGVGRLALVAMALSGLAAAIVWIVRRRLGSFGEAFDQSALLADDDDEPDENEA